jgi:hypothetical protein
LLPPARDVRRKRRCAGENDGAEIPDRAFNAQWRLSS